MLNFITLIFNTYLKIGELLIFYINSTLIFKS